MPSDIYRYRGTIGNIMVEVHYLDYQREHPNSSGISSVELSRKDGESITISQGIEEIIFKRINEGKIPLEYLGGYCSNGDAWGPTGAFLESSEEEQPW